MTLRGIFSGTTMRWATMIMMIMMMGRRIVLMERSALKHLIVAGIEIHDNSSKYPVCYYAVKILPTVLNSLHLAVFRESRE